MSFVIITYGGGGTSYLDDLTVTDVTHKIEEARRQGLHFVWFPRNGKYGDSGVAIDPNKVSAVIAGPEKH